MAKGRPSVPEAIKKATGNPGKRGSKTTADPELLADLSPPQWLSAEAKVVWEEEAPKFRKALLLTVLDVPAFAAMCQAQADYRGHVAKCIAEGEVWTKEQTDKNGNKVNSQAYMSPWAQLKSMSFKQLFKAMEKFGATPADRARVEVNPQMTMFPSAIDESKPENRAARHFH